MEQELLHCIHQDLNLEPSSPAFHAVYSVSPKPITCDAFSPRGLEIPCGPPLASRWTPRSVHPAKAVGVRPVQAVTLVDRHTCLVGKFLSTVSKHVTALLMSACLLPKGSEAQGSPKIFTRS